MVPSERATSTISSMKHIHPNKERKTGEQQQETHKRMSIKGEIKREFTTRQRNASLKKQQK